MAVRLDGKQTALDKVTTIWEITECTPISRGALVNAMNKSRFEWVKIGNAIIIDKDSFCKWYDKEFANRRQLDTQLILE